MENRKSDKELRNRKLVNGFFTILIVVVMLFSLVPATAIVTNTQNTDTTDSSSVEITKAKAASCKITWNGNSGKIGTKKTTTTTVKKGTKIGKLPTTPKRVGYAFKGWYTKKTGGTKITKNTVAKKKVTYYAQWKKNAVSGDEAKLMGSWSYDSSYYDPFSGGINPYSYIYVFRENGSFDFFYRYSASGISHTTGKYKVSNGKVYFSNIIYEPGDPRFEKRYKDTVFEYKVGKDTVGEYLLISSFPREEAYVDISHAINFRKA